MTAGAFRLGDGVHPLGRPLVLFCWRRTSIQPTILAAGAFDFVCGTRTHGRGCLCLFVFGRFMVGSAGAFVFG